MRILLIALVLSTIFIGCKRGENDPLISMKSRTSRLTGTWKLSNVSNSNVDTYVTTDYTSSYSQTNSFDGTIWTQTSSSIFDGGDPNTDTDTWSYSSEYTIDKNGTYTYKITNDGDVSEGSGDWMWLDQGDSKSSIILGSDIFIIDQLKNKEMILTKSSHTKSTDTDGAIYESTTTESYTYTKE